MRAVVLVCVCIFASATAVASPGGDIPLDAFRPAVDSRGFVTVDGAAVLDAGQPSFGLVTTWAKRPLVLDGGGAQYAIADVLSPTLVGAVGIGARGELGVALPLGVVAGDRVAEQGLGDLAFDGKLRLGATGPIGWAAIASATLPTGARDAWLSTGHAGVGARLVAETRLGDFRFGANAGIRAPLGGDASFMDTGDGTAPATGARMSLGPALPIGGALAWELAPGKIELVAEGFALVPLRGEGYFPIEALGGARFYLAHASHLEIGAGAGLGGAGGNPELRAFLGIVFEPTSPERASGHAELVADATPPPAPPPPAPPPVDDGSGDRDGDGIIDRDDLCPDEPEDYNGVEDEDGCPDADFHHDAIADVEDRCDRASCPDRDIVKVGDTTLILLEDIPFKFDSAELEPRASRVLDAVRDTMNANMDVTEVEVGGHTDERGPDAYNLALSQRRADAVVAYLVAHGVDAARLTAQGYGERVPKIDRHDEAAWRVNRRVEFVILERAHP